MLIPAVLVFIVAVRGYHFLAALSVGIVSACLIGPLTGIFSFGDLFHITAEGDIEGSMVKGAMGLVPISILTLLLITSIGLMREGGFLTAFKKSHERR